MLTLLTALNLHNNLIKPLNVRHGNTGSNLTNVSNYQLQQQPNKTDSELYDFSRPPEHSTGNLITLNSNRMDNMRPPPQKIMLSKRANKYKWVDRVYKGKLGFKNKRNKRKETRRKGKRRKK